MNLEYISKRLINDVAPIMKKNGYTKYINPKLFLEICNSFFNKEINNIQFREKIKNELAKINI